MVNNADEGGTRGNIQPVKGGKRAIARLLRLIDATTRRYRYRPISAVTAVELEVQRARVFAQLKAG